MKDLSHEARRKAIRSGTTLTSIALLIAIFTDMVGFLSFRLSSQQFLVVFGTVIAIGLFYVYLFSITALPALLAVVPPKDMKMSKSVKVERSPLIERIGSLSDSPMLTMLVAILITYRWQTESANLRSASTLGTTLTTPCPSYPTSY